MAGAGDVAPPPTPLTIRPGTTTDRLFVDDLTRRAFGSEMQATLERGLFRVSEFECLVADRAGEPEGFVAWDDSGGAVEAVVLAARRPGGGVGSALMEALAALAAERGARHVKVVTTAENEGARRFYERLGYSVADVRPGAVDEVRRRFKPEIPPGIHDEIEYRRPV